MGGCVMDRMSIKLQKEEIEEIENYSERMNSLKALILTFESDEVFSKKSNMYEKLVQDVSETNQKIRLWWTRMIQKYKLEKYNQEKLYVDFVSSQIELKDCVSIVEK